MPLTSPGRKRILIRTKEIRKINRHKNKRPLFHIPGSIALVLALVVVNLFTSPVASLFAGASREDTCGLFYARFDMKTVNGVVTDKNLLIVPAREEFRAENFKLFRVSGISGDSSGAGRQAEAKHDAISRMLMAGGLKSIENRSTSLKSGTHDEIVVSYEGVIRYPAKITRKGYVKENQYGVEMEIWFSPVSFPDRWAVLSLKHEISKTFDTIISIFK